MLNLLDKLDSAAHQQEGATLPHFEELKIVALSRLVVATYAVALETLLQEAGKLEDETWYWTDIEESTRKTLSFLVQTLPVRLYHVSVQVLELAAGTATNTLKSTLAEREESKTSQVKRVDKNTVRAALRSILDTPTW